jgi:hypothetical protein
MTIIPGAASPLTMEALLALAEFVKHPEYIDRIKELQAAQIASDNAAMVAAKELSDAKAALATLDTKTSKFKSDQLATAEQNQRTHDALVAREVAVTAREQALTQTMTLRAEQMAQQASEAEARGKALDDRDDAMNLREAQVKQREDAVTAREQRVDRKEALIKQAEAL